MLKVEEIRGLGVEEIQEKVEKLKKDLMQYRFQAKTGKLEKQNTIREVRRDIARLLTIITEKSSGVEPRIAAKPVKKAEPVKAAAKKRGKS